MSIGVEVQGHVGVIELQRPPHNFLSPALVEGVADALERFDRDPGVRAAVLAASGRSFCAGADFGDDEGGGGDAGGAGAGGGRRVGDAATRRLYAGAVRLAASATPFVAAVHGPAVGGGLGLAMVANLRVTCPEARWSANFAKLGIHQGFGLSVTLPEQIGPSKAALVLLTGRRFTGEQAVELGLADICVAQDEVRDTAVALAGEIAENAPMAVTSINRTLRAGLADRMRAATAHEATEQARLSITADAREGMRAVSERRPGNFTGR
jgi:enoyl-CoA hydratase/carnithine racemase